jgi:Cdc6-like AAA superfamily ATPase
MHLTENEMKMILDWLITTDPSSNHNNACQLHEEHTGQWLTNSPEYENWKSGQSRFLWLHGIPGAGKTVLLSYIAEDVKTFTRESEDLVSVYYYCYFGHNRDETTHFLRWVIGQLCRKIGGVPPEVRNMFREGVQPTATELLHVLCDVADNFSRVYITIDALDESANRAEILQMLCKIFESEKLTRIQLLATSRKELDIERALLPAAHELSLSNPYVDEDIRTYVKARLREDLKFSRWPDSLRNETESVLVKGAKGM